ncbi:orotate phosphoribosyltransferase [Candidatus Bathyarchaeota archaeon]|nr:orotate phosphoribosyltransferase [Candidatus Bathyarchaeota archaeon]
MSSNVRKIAEALVNSGALKFGNFKLKSGVTSPYYVDLTWLLSSPEDFRSVTTIIADEVKPIIHSSKVNKLATIELKGALLLPSIAAMLKLPCVVIRKESKTYGLTDRITGGEIHKGDRVIFFDDVITSGASKLEAIKPIEEAGGKIEAIVVVVDREQGGKQELEKHGYQVKPITTISEIAKTLVSTKSLTPNQAEKILKTLKERELNSKT